MPEGAIKRKLGLWTAIAISVGTTIGSGILISTGEVAKAAGSSAMGIFAWIIGGLIIIPQVFILSELATAYPEDGGGYIYLKEAGLKPLSFLYGWAVFWALDPPSIAILSLALVGNLSFFIPGLTGLTAKFVAVIIVVLLTAMHYRSVKAGGMFQVIVTIAKILPFICIAGVGLFFISGENLSSGAVQNAGSMGIIFGGVSATSWAYVGINSACNMAGEFKNPGKTLPKALIGSAVFIMLTYTLVATCVSGLLPYDALINSSAPIADAFAAIPGVSGAVAVIIAIASVFIILSSLSACVMAQPRLEYAMAKDNLFFKLFAHVNPKYETPDRSIIIQSSYGILLIFASSLSDLLGYFTLVYLLINILLYVSILFCRKKDNYKPIFKCPAVYFMMALAVLANLYLAWDTFKWAPIQGVIAGLVVIATGLPMYLFWKRKSDKKPEEVAGSVK